jgi:LemA protein
MRLHRNASLASSSQRTARARRGAIGRGCLIAGAVVLVPLLLIGLFLWSGYNGLVSAQESSRQAWAQVENQYKRRSDLIPNLVSTVQGASDFEQKTITDVTEARASVGRVALPADLPTDQAQLDAYVKAQATLGSALGRLFAVAENYPELKSIDNFRDLQSQIEGTENRITVAREDYTKAVAEFNKRVRRFPSNFVASLTGFEPLPQFTIPAEETEVPKVEFNR